MSSKGTSVHLVGSVGLDSVEEVFITAGKVLHGRLKRIPDGEPGGRRMWTNWQYPVVRSTFFVEVDPNAKPIPVSGFLPLRIREGTKPEEMRFGELGYQREGRASYFDFVEAREKGDLPKGMRFQVSVPTPFAVIWRFFGPEDRAALLAPYEEAMLREIAKLCAAIPHHDLAIQWDVCIEMLVWDGRWDPMPSFPGIERTFAELFRRLSVAVPEGVELGFHLCYGSLSGKHFIEPIDAAKMVSLANLICDSAGRRVDWMHMPVPVSRTDDAFFAPLKELRLQPSTELFLGVVHASDGVEGTRKRMAVARKYAPAFGIAGECGLTRAGSPEKVRELLRVHAGAAEEVL